MNDITMKNKLIFIILSTLLIHSKVHSSIYPVGGGIWFAIGGGIGYYNSDVVDEEKKFVNENQIVLTQKEDPNSEAPIDYRYTSYNLHFSLQYQISNPLSFGINYQNNIVTQKIETIEGIKAFDPERLMNYNQIGPVLSYWIHAEAANIILSTSINYVYGELYRVPVLYKNLYKTFSGDPVFNSFIKMYNKNWV